MRRAIRIGIAAGLILLLAPAPARAAEEPRWPKSPDELQVSLEIVHALEEGPVVLRVVLKNVSNETIHYATSLFEPGAFCNVVSDHWKRRKKTLRDQIGLIIGSIGPYVHQIQPGGSNSHVFYLHPSYLSIPSGEAEVEFGWKIFRPNSTRMIAD